MSLSLPRMPGRSDRAPSFRSAKTGAVAMPLQSDPARLVRLQIGTRHGVSMSSTEVGYVVIRHVREGKEVGG
jgi:hypothetical protein